MHSLGFSVMITAKMSELLISIAREDKKYAESNRDALIRRYNFVFEDCPVAAQVHRVLLGDPVGDLGVEGMEALREIIFLACESGGSLPVGTVASFLADEYPNLKPDGAILIR